MKNKHQPVLLKQTLAVLNPKSGESYLDGTAGYGGHAAAVIEKVGTSGRVVLVDRDWDAIKELTTRFGDRTEIIHDSFVNAAKDLAEDGSLFDLILLDLGVSSPQLDEASRGFSFRESARLDMRMDQSQSLSAADVVNTYREATLADILYRYGEETRSRAIARSIIEHRPITSTEELAAIIRRIVPKIKGIDPATKSFQAIRIEVNNELDSLSQVLPLLVRLLPPGGRLAVISFHSLEDRIVKQFFDIESRDCICPPKQPICTCGHTASLKKLLTRPISGGQDETNPRARSAKLRAAEKLKPKTKGG